jgi:hypothetical protein
MEEEEMGSYAAEVEMETQTLAMAKSLMKSCAPISEDHVAFAPSDPIPLASSPKTSSSHAHFGNAYADSHGLLV